MHLEQTIEHKSKQPGERAVVYARVSSAAQVAKGHGIASQETRCREFARMKGYEVAEVFRDEAISGGIMDRPGMLAMLDYLDRNRSSGPIVVIIDDISRLARNIRAHLDLRDAINEAGGRLESPSIEFGEDSDSILVENLLASVSQHQRQKNTEQVFNRQRARLLNGYWTFSKPPGYRYEARPGEGKVLVRDEPLASIIQEGMEGFASGRFQTQAEVKRFFESFPAFPKTRHRTVTNEAVNRILTRVLYAGHLERPDWNVPLRPAKHEGLVSLATFERIQARLNEGAKVPARANLDGDFPLRGAVLCGDCGKPLTACWSKSKTGKRHPYYACFKKGCESARKSIRRDELEGAFEALLQDIQPSPTLAKLARAMFEKAWDMQAAKAREIADTTRRKITEIERTIDGLLDRIVEATNPSVVARYEQRIESLERDKLLAAETLEKRTARHRPFGEMFELAMGFLSNPWNTWVSGSLAHKHAVLKMTFEERLVYRRNEGFRTPKTTCVFRALEGFRGSKTELAEGMGFEPTIGVSPYNGLANRRLQPLGHPSAGRAFGGRFPGPRTAYARPFYGPPAAAVKRPASAGQGRAPEARLPPPREPLRSRAPGSDPRSDPPSPRCPPPDGSGRPAPASPDPRWSAGAPPGSRCRPARLRW